MNFGGGINFNFVKNIKMIYSSIERKKCKCGCNMMPTISYEGYYYSHAPKEVLDRLDKKQKRKTAAKNTLAKLRAVDANEDENREVAKGYAELDRWFKSTRNKLTGTCQCGCGKPSSKYDDKYFKHSCSHVFPKAKFGSIKTHPRNFVERAFWGGCHTNMDEQSMDKWVGFTDWENIKEIFHELAPLLTDEERATKFYAHFEKLIYQ